MRSGPGVYLAQGGTQIMSEPYQELIYAVSHDLAAPVRHVQGFSRLLRERLADGGADEEDRPRTLELAEHLDKAANKLANMLDGILAVSRVGTHALSVTEVALGPVVHHAQLVAGMKRKLRDAVVVQSEPPLPMVRADEELLRRAVQAVIDNALLYAGGARVSCEVEDGRARLWVRDNGPGIDPTQHERIFRPLERGDPPAGTIGAGVGLAIARRALERFDGAVGVESQAGAGAAFWLELGVG